MTLRIEQKNGEGGRGGRGTLRVIMAQGKFHGVIRAEGPTGCLMVKYLRGPATGAGMMSPYMRLASSAYHSINPAAYNTSPRASAKGLPHSNVMMRAKSSILECMRPAILAIILERSFAVVRFHFCQASQLYWQFVRQWRQ